MRKRLDSQRLAVVCPRAVRERCPEHPVKALSDRFVEAREQARAMPSVVLVVLLTVKVY